MIYFIQQAKNLLIKIGYTSSDEPTGRLKSGQTWNPDGLEVLLTMPGTQDEEKALHRRFAEANVAGEWFKPTPELLRYAISQSTRLRPPPAAVAPPMVRPAPWPLRIYLAGKISRKDWRRSIVGDHLQVAVETCPCSSGESELLPVSWPVAERAIFGTHHFVGPYFVDCRHGGCAFGDDEHGVAATSNEPGDHGERLRPGAVADRCLAAVANCDVLFAFVHQLDCYGTIVEIGAAKALGKRIWITGWRHFRDMWFAYEMADKGYLEERCCAQPGETLRAFLSAYHRENFGDQG